MAVLTKPGVVFDGFTPALARLLHVICMLDRLDLPGFPPNLTITSGSDGGHVPGSAHFRFEALDLRTHGFANQAAIDLVVFSLKRDLGPLFYIAHEGKGTQNSHVHCQLRKGASYPPKVIRPTE